MVAVPIAELLVVEHVAGALLEVGGEASPLEDLGEDVRRLLAREVGTTELGDRVVAVLVEHPLVEVFSALEADRRLVGGHATCDLGDADLGLVVELVEEEPPHRFRRPAVAGEQGALHDLGQVDDAEDRQVDVGEEPFEDTALRVAERLDVVGQRGGGCGSGDHAR